MKRILSIFLPLAITIVTIFVVYLLLVNSPKAEPQESIKRLPVLQTVTARKVTVRVPVHTRGIVMPRTQVTLVSEVNGVVKKVSPQFNSGGFFKRGDVLITIDSAFYLLEITKKKSAVDSANMHLEEVTARAHVARRGAKKNATDFALHIPQIKDAKSQLAAANADLQLARLQLSHTEIKAPFDGRIKSVNINKDQYVSQGELLADIYALDVAEVRLPISDHHLSLIDLPMHYQDDSQQGVVPTHKNLPPVKLTSVIGGQRYSWKGVVVRSEGGVDENRLLYVVAEVNNPYARDVTFYRRPPLEIGRFVEAEIGGREQKRIIALPREALRGENKVWIVNLDERLVVRSVDVLYRGRDQVFIRSGIDSGDKVVLTALDFVVDGMKVQLANTLALSSSL